METKIKYIIIIIIAVILVAAFIITATLSKSKTNNDNDESFIAEESGDGNVYEPVSMNDDVQVDFENINDSLAEEFENHNIETMFTTAYQPQSTTVADIAATTKKDDSATQKTESTTKKADSTTQKYTEKTTVKTENTTAASDTILREIDSFFKGKYYFDGTMVSGGTSSPFEIAMNGEDFIVYSEMDGIDMGILSIDNELYLINPDEKKYTVINSTVQNMMEINPEDLKFDFNGTGFNGYAPTSVTQALFDGEDAVCYTYKNSENAMDFIVVNNEIKQITQYNKNGEKLTVLQADEFTVDYSEDMVSLKGYKKTNLISFITNLMGGLK